MNGISLIPRQTLADQAHVAPSAAGAFMPGISLIPRQTLADQAYVAPSAAGAFMYDIGIVARRIKIDVALVLDLLNPGQQKTRTWAGFLSFANCLSAGADPAPGRLPRLRCGGSVPCHRQWCLVPPGGFHRSLQPKGGWQGCCAR